ncbi:MAG: hypothetical protein M3256_03685 [Actinomycetota bacterium]|nr:hypothetical protein [Actinomycetota bacterium]
MSFWLDVIAAGHVDQAKLQAEVLALCRSVQVLQRAIKRVRWSPGDRLVLAALSERIPPSVRAGLLVKPETVLGWHRELVRRKWAAYRGRPRRGRPPASEEFRELIMRMARKNSRWGYFRIRGELLKLPARFTPRGTVRLHPGRSAPRLQARRVNWTDYCRPTRREGPPLEARSPC